MTRKNFYRFSNDLEITEDELLALKEVLYDCVGNTENFEDYISNSEILSLNNCRNGRKVAWCIWTDNNQSCRYVDTLEKLSEADIEKELL